MSDAAVLQNIFRREGRSLLQYVSEAFPWVTQEETEALARLQVLVEDEQQALAELMRYFRKRRIAPPHLGPYPMTFTNMNYISLDHLLPVLTEYEQRSIVQLEQDLGRLSDVEARERVQRILAVKRRHLETLSDMAKARNPVMAGSVA
jgi:hypothetical protein